MKAKKKVEAEVWKASRNVYPKLSSLKMLRPDVEIKFVITNNKCVIITSLIC